MLSYDSPIPITGKATTIAMTSVPDPNQATTTEATPEIPSASTNGTISPQDNSAKMAHHIWLITGPAGVGKSTVAAHLAEYLGYPFLEGDDYHPEPNIQKMTAGTPLTDADRWDWLTRLREASLKEIKRGSEGVVLTCSALKRKYRDVIRVAGYFDHSLVIHFILLSAPKELLLSRVKARQGHYMGPEMVESQLNDLEPPRNEEDVVEVDVGGSLEEVQKKALEEVQKIMEKQGGGVNGGSC